MQRQHHVGFEVFEECTLQGEIDSDILEHMALQWRFLSNKWYLITELSALKGIIEKGQITSNRSRCIIVFHHRHLHILSSALWYVRRPVVHLCYVLKSKQLCPKNTPHTIGRSQFAPNLISRITNPWPERTSTRTSR